MVVGEPGIGKTTVCQQLATYAKLRGGMTLVGHCYEEGSISLPYLAFVEAMRSYVLERDADGLRSDLGSGASEIARIVSEVRERLDVEPSAAGDPEQDRYRLMQAVTSFLTNAASVQPLVIVLGGPARRRQRHAGHADTRLTEPLGRPADAHRDLPRR